MNPFHSLADFWTDTEGRQSEEVIYTSVIAQERMYYFVNKIRGSPYASELRQNRGGKSGKIISQELFLVTAKTPQSLAARLLSTTVLSRTIRNKKGGKKCQEFPDRTVLRRLDRLFRYMPN